jgi:hypothetical protein
LIIAINENSRATTGNNVVIPDVAAEMKEVVFVVVEVERMPVDTNEELEMGLVEVELEVELYVVEVDLVVVEEEEDVVVEDD